MGGPELAAWIGFGVFGLSLGALGVIAIVAKVRGLKRELEEAQYWRKVMSGAFEKTEHRLKRADAWVDKAIDALQHAKANTSGKPVEGFREDIEPDEEPPELPPIHVDGSESDPDIEGPELEWIGYQSKGDSAATIPNATVSFTSNCFPSPKTDPPKPPPSPPSPSFSR